MLDHREFTFASFSVIQHLHIVWIQCIPNILIVRRGNKREGEEEDEGSNKINEGGKSIRIKQDIFKVSGDL